MLGRAARRLALQEVWLRQERTKVVAACSVLAREMSALQSEKEDAERFIRRLQEMLAVRRPTASRSVSELVRSMQFVDVATLHLAQSKSKRQRLTKKLCRRQLLFENESRRYQTVRTFSQQISRNRVCQHSAARQFVEQRDTADWLGSRL